MMKRIFLILGDQLSEDHPFLKREKWQKDELLLMIESLPRAGWLPYHPQKLLYVFACMRRFGQSIEKNLSFIPFSYIKASEKTFTQILNELGCGELNIVEPSEPRSLSWIKDGLAAELVIHANPFFLADSEMLPAKPPYLLESFYRKVRKKFNILMEDGEPTGGQWNYDKENRLPPDAQLQKNPPREFLNQNWLDAADQKNYEDIEQALRKVIPADRFGDWTHPLLPTHRATAQKFLETFVSERLANFGPYEDAMVEKAVGLFHSGLSAIMNLQILSVREIVASAEAVPSSVPLASREGFIRQVVGWREFVRLIYLRHTADYEKSNFFGFEGTLAPLYWGAPTHLNCLSTIVRQVRENAYSHHIPRLMVLGNFALLTKTNPHEVNRWFWSVYLDAYEWVVTPNVLGMSQFADGGVFATKPYVSGANYINKMSNYCKSCRFDPKQTVGDNACPFNSLYWNFIDESQRLKVSRPSFAQRMSLMWGVWNKKSDAEKESIRHQAKVFTDAARSGQL